MRPKTYDEPRVQVAVRLPESLHSKLTEAAYERDLSVNRMVEWAVQEYLDRLIPLSELVLTRRKV